MEWKLLDCKDRELIDSYTRDRFSTCDYNFTNQLLWSKGEDTTFKIEEDVLLIKGNYQGKEYYYMPIPKDKSLESLSSWKRIINKILEDGKEIYLVPEEYKELLEDEFNLVETRDSFDYIYSSTDLGTLKGRKFTKKKNKVNSFTKKNDYTYEVIDNSNIDEVIAFQKRWYANNESIEVLDNENQGIMLLLENYIELGLKGAIIRIEGEIIAYTIGERLNDESAVIHIEKAIGRYIGSYQAINYLFAQKELKSFKYINREDDFGNEGLREAKLSYNPVILLKKYQILSKK